MINKKLIICLLFVSAIAMCAGSFYEVYLNGIGKEQLMELLYSKLSSGNSSGFLILLKSSLISNFKTWLFLFLCPLIPIFAIFCPFICIAKGISVGFSSTMLIEIFGFKGVIYILTTIIPQNLIQLPLYSILSSIAIQMSLVTLKFYIQRGRKRNKNVLQETARHYILLFLIALCILLISCVIEACLKQFLL